MALLPLQHSYGNIWWLLQYDNFLLICKDYNDIVAVIIRKRFLSSDHWVGDSLWVTWLAQVYTTWN